MSNQFLERKPIKLLYWTPRFWPDVGGIQMLSKKALPALQKRGYEIAVLTSHSSPRDYERSDFNGIPVHRFPFWSTLTENNVLQVLTIQKQIQRIVTQFDPDIIHYDFSGYTALFLNSLLKHFRKPFLISLHGGLENLSLGSDTLISRLIHAATWVTGVSDYVVNDTQKFFPEISDRISRIHGFADFPGTSPKPLPNRHPVILGFGRLEPIKGFDILIEAVRILSDECPSLEVKILGDGSQRVKLQQMVEEYGLSQHVELTGMIPNSGLPDWLNQAYLIVVPSREHEPFGIVAAEAGLLARPVIASNIDGLKEIILDGETGLLVPPEDPNAMADAIRKLMTQSHIAEKMGQRARSRVINKFSLMNYVDQYDKLYCQLTDQYQEVKP